MITLGVCVCVCTESEVMIKIEGKNQARSCLPDRSEMMCTFAVSTLDGVCRSICSGDIVVRELQMIIERKDQMEKLCSAVKSGNLDRRGKEYDTMKAALDDRIKEFIAFMGRKNLLGGLCRGVTVNVTGMFICKIHLMRESRCQRNVMLNFRLARIAR